MYEIIYRTEQTPLPSGGVISKLVGEALGFRFSIYTAKSQPEGAASMFSEDLVTGQDRIDHFQSLASARSRVAEIVALDIRY